MIFILSFEKLKLKTEEMLPENIYIHCIRTSENAAYLAGRLGLDAEKARIAGLLHDIGLSLSQDEIISLCMEKSPSLSIEDIRNPEILHGLAGGIIAKQDIGTDDDDILLAIVNHNGRAGMTDIEKIVLIADFCDEFCPQTLEYYFKDAEITDLNSIMFIVMRYAVPYCAENGITIPERTIEAFDYLIEMNYNRISAPVGMAAYYLDGSRFEDKESEFFDKAIEINRLHGLNTESVSNIRDLGGYISTDGRTIKKNMLIRSQALTRLTPKDAAFLENYGIKTVIDLRDKTEITVAPDINTENFEYINCPLPIPTRDALEYRERIMKKKTISFTMQEDIWYNAQYFKNADMLEMYKNILKDEKSIEQLKKIFGIILNSDGGILFHCTSGKDRTGVIAILIMVLAGIDIDSVESEYYASMPFNFALAESMALDLKNEGYGADIQNAARSVVGLDLRLIEKLSRWFCDKYGDALSYLKKVIGLSDKDIADFNMKYTSEEKL